MNPQRQSLANAIRALSMDAVQQAKSGHPGMPMGMADIAEVLWNDCLRFNPSNPQWMNRDRFVLSNGHGSMLLYSVLHLTGYDLSLEDIKQFRQVGSKTPGHPEYGHTPGVETTTGPLGQGLANAVGMAIAETRLAAEFNRPDFSIVDHHTYAFVGDGCLMEGLSHEACSLAGTLGLGKLIVIYDDNGISIDGEVTDWFSENVLERFQSYQWQVIEAVDGHDADAIHQAILAAQADTQRPTIICCRTQIGFGSPNRVGTAGVHGAPLGDEEIALTREALNWSHAPFEVPDTIYQHWDGRAKGAVIEGEWNALFAAYEQQYPELAKAFLRRQHGELLPEFYEVTMQAWQAFQSTPKAVATRQASLHCLEAMCDVMPEFMGGSADLSGSNCTLTQSATAYTADNPQGNYLHYGVRELGMSAIMNGMALHGGLIPFGGTFLVFSDYARSAIRLSAMMQARVVYVLTHDSIGVGEDGPTHQPIEHLTALRLIPNVHVWRPASAAETMVAWRSACEHTGPTCLALSRQSMPVISREVDMAEMSQGAYVAYQSPGECDCLLMASGSEVGVVMEAAQQLEPSGIACRVISVPCMEQFAEQSMEVKEAVMPSSVSVRIAVEAGVGLSWRPWVGDRGQIIAIEQFGLSGPAQQVYQAVGLTSQRVVDVVKAQMAQRTVNME